MEAMGQMGNSEEATIPDDLPFTMDDLLVVVTGEEEPKEKDDEPIKAQAGTFVAPTQPAGTFVPANQQLNNMGVMGFQQSMYGQQGAQNPVAVAPQVPASSVVPTVQAPPTGGYTAPTVPATLVNQTEFVPDVSDIYKPVKYINPTTGETMTINEYQGNPVSAVPAGFIRYDDYIAQGGKDPSEEEGVTTGVESTSVQTAQVAGAQDDESKAKASNLEKMREDRERKRVQEYNRVFNTESDEFTNKNNANYITDDQLIDAYKDQIEAETIAPLIPGVGILAAGMTRLGRGKVNAAMEARFGPNFKELPEFKDITRGSVLKETGSEILGDLKQGLTKEGLGFGDKTDPKNFYNNYNGKYEVGDYDSTRGGTGFKKDPVTGALSGNLNVKEQQAFDNAVDRGDDAIANHFSLVAASRDEKDKTAAKSQDLIKQARVAKEKGDTEKLKELKADIKANNTGKVQLGDASIDEIIEHGSSSLTAVNEGRSEPSTGIFKAPKPKKDDDKSSIFNKDRTLKTAKKDPKPPKSSGFAGMGDDPAAQFGGSPMASSSSRSSSSSSSSSSPSAASAAGGCVIATHAVASGAFQANDKVNAVEWCKKTLHDKWWGETMRRGYRYLGRKHIANGTAETVYKEFKECIEWANGKRPFTIKVAGRYYYRAIQTFFVGLFVKEDV
jgi:tellurite resistance protein